MIRGTFVAILREILISDLEKIEDRMKKIIISFLLVLSIAALGAGQESQNTKNSADQMLRANGVVNPSTLGLEMNIPLGSYPGRGINLPIGLSYSSKLWRFEPKRVWITPHYHNGEIQNNGGDGGAQDLLSQGNTFTYASAEYSENAASGWTSSLAQPYIEYTGLFTRFNGFGNPIVTDYWTPPLPLEAQGNFQVKRITVNLPGGISYELRESDAPISVGQGVISTDGTYLSVDGSGIRYEENFESGRFRLFMPDGSFYDFKTGPAEPRDYNYESHPLIRRAAKLTDRNGNYITFNESEGTNSNYPYGSITDQLGRKLPVMIPRDNLAAPIERSFVLPGMMAPYKLKWDRLQDVFTLGKGYSTKYKGTSDNWEPPQTQDHYFPALFNLVSPPSNVSPYMSACTGDRLFILANQDGDGSSGQANLFDPVVLSEITLPNGAKYRFTYNPYGEIEQIVYPTGGREELTYEKVDSLAQLASPYQLSNRGVTHRDVYEGDDDSRPDSWRYEAKAYPNDYRTIVTAPDLTKTVRFMHRGVPSGAPPDYVCEVHGLGEFPNNNLGLRWGYDNVLAGRTYDERVFSSNGDLIQRTRTRWAKSYSETDMTNDHKKVQFNARVQTTESITYDGISGVRAVTKLDYFDLVSDAGSALTKGSPLNIKRKTEYGYSVVNDGSISPSAGPTGTPSDPTGAPMRITEIDYKTDPAYLERGFAKLPVEVRVSDGSNNLQAKSQMTYDEQGQYYSNVDYGSTTGYQAPTGPYAYVRANPTTKRTWNGDTNSWIEAHTQFDNFGNVRKVWDTSGDITRYLEYEFDSYYKFAYLTKTRAPAPDPSGLHGMSQGSDISYTFDFMTGLPLTVTDANGQTATTEYNDLMLRPTRVVPPDGGAISEKEYNDTERWVKSRQQIDQTNWVERTVYFDTLGRPFKTRTKDPQGDVFSQTRYDIDTGRLEKLSNPYREGDTVYWSKPRYDAAGRVVETFAPAPDGQTGASLGTVQFGISTDSGLVGTYQIATDASGRKSRIISGIYGIMRVDEATGIGGTVDQDLGPIGSPNQPTSYSYNTKGELIKITQGKADQSGQLFQKRYFLYDSLGRLIRARQPEQTPNSALATSGNPENNSWTAAFTYDLFGNVITTTDAKNTVITNEYDKASRPVKRMYSDGTTPQAEYFYDGKGLPAIPQFSRGAITKVTNGISEDRFTSFDNQGRLLTSQQVIDGQTYAFGYKYNLSGGLTEETYPSGRTVKSYLNSDGGLNSVKTKAVGGLTRLVVSNIDYSATGDIRKMRLGNGLWETAVVTERSQLKQIGLGTTETNNDLFKIEYDYGELSADGNSVDLTKNTGMIARTTTTIPTTSFTQTFKYDAINRLKEAKEKTGVQTNWQQTFGYDIFGNRTSFSQTVNGVQLPMNNLTLPTIDPTKNQFTTGQGYVYDYNGNLIQDAEGRHFTFDGNDKQIEVKDAGNQTVGEYYYDASGARVKKVVPSTGETTVFVYDAGGALAAEYSTIVETQNPTTNYLTTDHLGSPRVITDQNQNVVSRRDFMPFGEEIGVGVGGRTTALKYSASGSDKIRKRYTGYEKDTETELDFAEARMYQNKHGRFTAVDPLMSSANPINPQTFNRYTYTGNNPINNTDPSGLCIVNGSEDGKPCNNVSGRSIYTNGTDFSTGKEEGFWLYEGPAIQRTFYGVVYEITTSGWRQVGTAAAVLARIRESLQASPGGTNDDPTVAGSSSPGGQTAPQGALPLPCPEGMSGCGSGNDVADHLVEGATAEEAIEVLQTTLDGAAATEIPFVSQGAGLGSAGIDVGRGDWSGAGMSMLGLFPFAGDAADAAKIARRIGRAAHVGEEIAEASHVVYQGVDKATGAVKYVGITARDPAVRFAEHAGSGTEKALLRFEVIDRARGLTKIEARVWEQNLINKHGLDTLLNQRNSIAPKHWKTFGVE